MKTTVIGSNKGKETVNSAAANSKAQKETVNGLPISSAFEDQVKPETAAMEAEQSKTEPTKAEIKAQFLQEKPALGLEQTLKKIKDLGRLSNQRDKLIETTDTLDAFEIAQLDEAEETNLNHFQACTLIIKDDTGREFKTKNPFIIDKTANQIKTLCLDKLAEVEAQISLTL